MSYVWTMWMKDRVSAKINPELPIECADTVIIDDSHEAIMRKLNILTRTLIVIFAYLIFIHAALFVIILNFIGWI